VRSLQIFLATILFLIPGLLAQEYSKLTSQLIAQAAEDHLVWVNTATGIYHYPGTRWYGHTKQGKFMSEKDAIAQGYRPAKNGQ